MPTMVEALAAHYKVTLSAADVNEIHDLQANRLRSTDKCPMGTTIPSKHQNRLRSEIGRAHV